MRPTLDAQADEFYRFGRKIVHVSAKENRGKAELMDAIASACPSRRRTSSRRPSR